MIASLLFIVYVQKRKYHRVQLINNDIGTCLGHLCLLDNAKNRYWIILIIMIICIAGFIFRSIQHFSFLLFHCLGIILLVLISYKCFKIVVAKSHESDAWLRRACTEILINLFLKASCYERRNDLQPVVVVSHWIISVHAQQYPIFICVSRKSSLYRKYCKIW